MYSNKINRLHETCHGIILHDTRSFFEDLLEKDNSVSIHLKNLHALAKEKFKAYTKTSPEIIQEVFQLKDSLRNQNLTNQTDFVIPYVKSYGIYSKRVLAAKIWECLPRDMKSQESVDGFKTVIKKPDSCRCRFCKTHLQNLGYL